MKKRFTSRVLAVVSGAFCLFLMGSGTCSQELKQVCSNYITAEDQAECAQLCEEHSEFAGNQAKVLGCIRGQIKYLTEGYNREKTIEACKGEFHRPDMAAACSFGAAQEHARISKKPCQMYVEPKARLACASYCSSIPKFKDDFALKSACETGQRGYLLTPYSVEQLLYHCRGELGSGPRAEACKRGVGAELLRKGKHRFGRAGERETGNIYLPEDESDLDTGAWGAR